MDNKIKVEKRNLMGLVNTVKRLTDQVMAEKQTANSVRVFWSNKYSILKAILLDCKSDDDLKFVKKNIKNNTLTEEKWSSYKRRIDPPKVKKEKNNKIKNKIKIEVEKSSVVKDKNGVKNKKTESKDKIKDKAKAKNNTKGKIETKAKNKIKDKAKIKNKSKTKKSKKE